jgi:hypothetical protein
MAVGPQQQPDQGPRGTGVLSNIYVTFLNLIAQVTAINSTLGKVFPQATGSAGSASSGGASSLPGNPAGYALVNLPGVGLVKMPYYNL